jgi:DNA-directed RNA polymerase II subunit RPB2
MGCRLYSKKKQMEVLNEAAEQNDAFNNIVERFVKEVPISHTITASFDSFISKQVGELISSLKPIECSHFGATSSKKVKLTLTQPKLIGPLMLENDATSRPIYPNECRIRNLSYSGPLYVNIAIERSDGLRSFLKDVYIGRMPIMIYSNLCHVKNPDDRVMHNECPRDPGGYFIINGSEKTLIGQKGHVSNRIVSYKSRKSSAVAVKSEKKHRLYVTTIKYVTKRPMTITFPRLENETPLITLLIALGLTVEQIESAFTPDEMVYLEPSFTSLPTDMSEARRRIRIRQVYDVGKTDETRLDIALDLMLVPHIPTKIKEDGTFDFSVKACFLLQMVKELIAVESGVQKPTDRDSVINQRVHMSYTLLSKLFLQLLIKWREDIGKVINMKISRLKRPISDESIIKTISSNTGITDGISYALATGNWNTVYVDRGNMKGVSQALERISYVATISQLRKVSSSVDPEMKNPQPRFLPGTHYGRYCPAETPEGATVGLETTLAISAYVSLETNHRPVLKVVSQYLNPINVENMYDGYTVYMNGIYIGNTLDSVHLIYMVRKARRSGQFAKDIAISRRKLLRQIHISTTFGRVTRPLLIVENGKLRNIKGSWYEMISTGVIEYLDAEEEDTCLVAFYRNEITKEHTHCEISNTFMNGINAASIPFSDHNPAPRNTFQSAMGKQPQGIYATNFQHRMDTTSNIMYYPQKPLVTTRMADLYNMHECPNGMNAIVAIMPFHGFGQEDSIIVKQESLDRGMARADHLKVVEDRLSKNSKESSDFVRPVKKKKFGKYDKLDTDGLLRPGVQIDKRDCIIGKEKIHHLNNIKEDASTLSELNGRVVETKLFQGKDGTKGVKMKIRTVQVPVIGDKFASRHGQKGTIGMIYPEVDMPFTMSGIIPDIIVNPQAIPSRMTVGHLIETLTGKVTSLTGERFDASPFTGIKVEDIALKLKEAGFQKYGNEVMINGITGEMIKAPIFIGPIFYQRLKHMVDYKMHARGRGRRNQLTKQPNEGRSQGGGLRVGEMEKDAMGAHGCPAVIQDRMLICSDAHNINVCPQCGTPVSTDRCKRCNTDTKEVTVPYAANLLFQELKSMCINVKLQV